MKYKSCGTHTSPGRRRSTAVLFLLALFAALISSPLLAQQTGEIAGTVFKAEDGTPIAGVEIQATAPQLPGVRTTTSSANGDYRLPLLPPGEYTLVFKLPDGTTRQRATQVLLQQRSRVDLPVQAGGAAVEEVVVVGSSTLTETSGATINAAISNEVFDALPVGQEYRDLVKLIPGVQFTQDSVRGPSAGGSGQDNQYQFDGVDVTLPMFGTLSAEPATHDIDQVSIVRGGAKAIGFNRSGGFTINTTSKSGTNEFHGMVSYQAQTAGMTGDLKNTSSQSFDQDQDWTTANFSGPLLKDQLYFYVSYYRPTVTRENRANVYGDVPDFKSTRDEYFGKLTWAPTDNLLFDASYRTSDRTGKHESVGSFSAASTSTGSKASQDIGILEGSWIINDSSNAYFKYTDFSLDTSSQPDNLFDFQIRVGDPLNVGALDTQGLFFVPTPLDDNPDFNDFVQPLIDQYGFIGDNGQKQGGGAVGGGSTINDQDFNRQSFELGYDLTLEGDTLTHDLHFGWKWSRDEEDLARLSNGWGAITVPGGTSTTSDGTPIFYQARFEQMSLLDAGGNVVPPIHSETESQSFEINDTIHWNDWHFNIGLMASRDEYFGQGLKANPNNISGFELAPGHKYKMKTVDFGDMLAPRLGVTWDFSDRGSAFLNYSRYFPATSSLSRAASWARNLRRSIRAYFDENGNFIAVDPVRSSSGKVFQEGIEPRYIDEYIVGGNWEFSDRFTGRAHFRYREGRHFWEDTNNNARIRYEAPDDIPHELYVPNLDEIRAEIGGSSYVIAQLDHAYTRYWEMNFEGEYNGDNLYLMASYVYSEYTGNFDQDNSTTTNDANTFVGSSFIADGAGRQLWNYRKGTLRGDRPHLFKVYGSYSFSWNGNFGAYFIWQSGQPWETWSYEPYSHLTGSRSDTSRYAEPAGSHRSPSHYQLDLNYTQNFYFGADNRYAIQLRADLYNVFDKQTGYNIQPKIHSAGYGEPRNYYRPRRLQLAARFLF